MDFALLNYLKTLPPDTVLYAVVLAVLLSPLIYRWRLAVGRWLRRLAWVARGVVIGVNL